MCIDMLCHFLRDLAERNQHLGKNTETGPVIYIALTLDQNFSSLDWLPFIQAYE